ncbi:hypothetical protein BLNAU_3913 [Blattamonas nauphoetae]|uniref:Uncharacterized protein n=1 Tax=Blattamonas nauphoetae TaxID=2049346 RepID=A0ABQ9YBS7_9EUKA|nr:hypothetical protein BLNAU_3913 [Blattamonas nauphoetae]
MTLSTNGLGNSSLTSECNISSLLEVLQCDDEDLIVDTLRTLQKVASDFIDSTFDKIGESSPPPAVITTLARISLFPHLRIAFNSLTALYDIIQQNRHVFTLLPSLTFPSSSPFEQFSGLPFLAALTKKLRIVFSEFQTNLPTDPSHLPKYIKVTKDDPYQITCSLPFCSSSIILPTFLLHATPPIEVDSAIIHELILFVKEALPTILTNIANIDNLITSLPSDSSPTTPLVSGVDTHMTDSLDHLRDKCEDFVNDGLDFFVDLTYKSTEPHKSSFQTIVLDDPSFPDLILNSLKLNHEDIRLSIFIAITNIVLEFEWMKEKFMTVNLVGRMFETVDFVSLPLSESETLFRLTNFIAFMVDPIGDDEEAKFKQYRLIRVSVLNRVEQFITFIFHNSDKLILDEEAQTQLQYSLCWIHRHITNMELRSDEHDPDFVSELVKWEVRTMIEMEREDDFEIILWNMQNRTYKWNHDFPERQKRRAVVLREEGWDDVFELRVVGIEADTNQDLVFLAAEFRVEQALNADER